MANVFTFYGKTNSSKSNQTGPVDYAFAEETTGRISSLLKGFLLKFSNFRRKKVCVSFL